MWRYYKGTNKALNWIPIAEDLFTGSIRAIESVVCTQCPDRDDQIYCPPIYWRIEIIIILYGGDINQRGEISKTACWRGYQQQGG